MFDFDDIEQCIAYAKILATQICGRYGIAQCDIDDLISDACIEIARIQKRIDAHRTKSERGNYVYSKIRFAILESARLKIRGNSRLHIIHTEFFQDKVIDNDINRLNRVDDIKNAVSQFKEGRVKDILLEYMRDGGYTYNKYIAQRMNITESEFSRGLHDGIRRIKKILSESEN